MFYLFPLPCSLLPAPCSLKPRTLYLTQIIIAINCVSTPLRTDLCPPALSKPDLLLFGLGDNDDSSLDGFVSSPRKFCCCQTTASNSLF
ncbi:MAG: hypothetical protein F6J90_38525 [Moorea sp. SIOASIH]|uniref:hypothetical protein n=1 Tax=Moorena sp. SIOASIH TaxID=2607817 RepID=UPI0013BCBFDF|nr:hypothetical protein [Moorena sp. SIOASIH]NEO41904.1 hypothetical protein [Moorena sp. SIOASIH]